jgi:hypothetical protein
MADVERSFTYDKTELRHIWQAFKAMDEESIDQAKKVANKLSQYAADEIKKAARTAPNSKVATRVADGVKVSVSSKTGEISFGFASQKFSGGATTQFNYANEGGNGLLAGAEFGSKKYKQFAPRSPRFGARGNEGYFIYPTLRRIQPNLIRQWELAFSEIVGKY